MAIGWKNLFYFIVRLTGSSSKHAIYFSAPFSSRVTKIASSTPNIILKTDFLLLSDMFLKELKHSLKGFISKFRTGFFVSM